MQNPEVIINGHQGDQISTIDRGLIYGDGVFETIAVKQGEIQFWDDHLKRLEHGCDVLSITPPDFSELKKETQQLIQAKQNCIIKIIVTRGVGGRGYKPEKTSTTRIVQKFPWPDLLASFKQGVEVTQCQFQLAQQSKLAQIKHLNRLEQVLARSEWEDDYQEGLVCDTKENIIEGTSSNVFFEQNNCLITPDLTQCGVAGVMRKKIIEYCLANDIQLQIRDLHSSEVADMEGMMLCNSVIGVWPVRRYCGRELSKTAIIERLSAVFNS